MKTSEIRRRFLEFFEKHEHRVVPAGSLVPGDDPTLLFTNAGMNQFKDVFLGTDRRDYSRATTAQRCVRAGGKHNDLENVGYTARHHTFFEMLGNFSFGDYFKQDAIRFAWTFLTEELGLPKEKLWVTVYQDDDEAADIWINDIGVDPNRLSRLGDKDNFWMMGDTGPCGPCSEIFYDHGEEVPGGPPGSPDDDLDRYIEIWNLVFMQFDTLADGSRVPLPKPSVDTGMGLERLAAILQGVHSNYEIDLFQALIRAAMRVTGCTDIENRSLRVIADHIRSTAFLIADGVIPSNEGRGYVLRRIIRRAVRHGYKLGCQDLFLFKLVDDLVDQMGEAYPELAEQADHVRKVLKIEEEQFARTLENGMTILEQGIADIEGNVIPGELVFKLYDTYGFPADLTADVAREKGLDIDQDGFESRMAEQRKRAQSANKFKMDRDLDLALDGATNFLGYETLAAEGQVIRLLRGEDTVSQLSVGDEGVVILDQTPFYAESGGQAGDRGVITTEAASLEVIDCQKHQGHFLHQVRVTDGVLKTDDRVAAKVQRNERENTARHHSATHLLHAALREVLGTHVQQRGSLVTHDKLRFDFSHLEAVTAEELVQIETLVNHHIMANAEVTTELMDIDSAKAAGAVALFGEKYDDQVRVLTMGEDAYSKELCGGTHVQRTGDIGLFRIVAESGIAAGIRRVEAVAGPYALAEIRQRDAVVNRLSGQFKCSVDQLESKVQQAVAHSKDLEKELSKLKDKLASAAAGDLTSEVKDVQGVKVLAVRLDGVDAKSLRSTMDQMKSKLGSAVILIVAVDGEKVQLAAGVTKDLTATFKAGNLIKDVGALMGAKGGGKPDMAMAGGGDINKIPDALQAVPTWVEQQLSN
ncbi:alanine--tRNA ligase [Reinekea blandensis]|uniref:Alanine--tRNA ligase n=1 Tax=Reinekea blandensis MED297 TaxID=314283 RepID=A4BCJ2_9GAMM|nr:alanine--tRNA ligase [Reinekea blandensis]EAR10258.1 Alanyl-tRNA synthetase [Reinekea sp. MED297] [Reinekea blandensis MED297]